LLARKKNASPRQIRSSKRYKIGITEAHCKETIIEFARYLIAAGATIVFGGYFGSDSIGEWLLRILEVYGHSEGPQALRMNAVFPFPIGLKLRSEQKELLSRLLHYRVVPPPDDICLETQAGQGLPSDPSSFESKLVWTRCLTVARIQIAKDVDAIVVTGGKETGFMGRYLELKQVFFIGDGKTIANADRKFFVLNGATRFNTFKGRIEIYLRPWISKVTGSVNSAERVIVVLVCVSDVEPRTSTSTSTGEK
jgi:hypothetical protein